MFQFLSDSLRAIFSKDNLFCLSTSTSDHFFTFQYFSRPMLSQASNLSCLHTQPELISWCHQRIITSQPEMLFMMDCIEYINLSVTLCFEGHLKFSAQNISALLCHLKKFLRRFEWKANPGLPMLNRDGIKHEGNWFQFSIASWAILAPGFSLPSNTLVTGE